MVVNDLITMRHLVLAFDIERSGGRSEHETIGIGASVVDENFKELDSLFLPGFFPETHPTPTVFEQRCWDEFWVDQKHTLDIIEYTGPLSKEERHKEMIEKFQAFRAKWEDYADENKIDYLLVSDNVIYDGGYINELINQHLPGVLPIPYTASKQEYAAFLETHSVQKGLLMLADPERQTNWGQTKRIKEMYKLPKTRKNHDHNPANDAYTIAMEMQVLYGIQEGRIVRKDDDSVLI